MKKIEIKHRFTGAVLYTHESEKATIKTAVIEAVENGVNLSNADLSNADLRYADLSDADLRYAIKVPMYCKWTHGITNENLIHIGCKKRTIEEWDKFFAGNETLSTERNTSEFKQIEAVYLAYKAYLTHLKS